MHHSLTLHNSIQKIHDFHETIKRFMFFLYDVCRLKLQIYQIQHIIKTVQLIINDEALQLNYFYCIYLLFKFSSTILSKKERLLIWNNGMNYLAIRVYELGTSRQIQVIGLHSHQDKKEQMCIITCTTSILAPCKIK